MSLYGNNDRVHTAGIANLEEGLKKNTGTSADRPTESVASSQAYFDTDLGIPLWWTGSVWVDAAGNTL